MHRHSFDDRIPSLDSETLRGPKPGVPRFANGAGPPGHTHRCLRSLLCNSGEIGRRRVLAADVLRVQLRLGRHESSRFYEQCTYRKSPTRC